MTFIKQKELTILGEFFFYLLIQNKKLPREEVLPKSIFADIDTSQCQQRLYSLHLIRRGLDVLIKYNITDPSIRISFHSSGQKTAIINASTILYFIVVIKL